jgi:hypothetical protein
MLSYILAKKENLPPTTVSEKLAAVEAEAKEAEDARERGKAAEEKGV